MAKGKWNSLTFTECSVNSASNAILKITQPQYNVCPSRATKYATNVYGKYVNTFKINQITFTYGEGKMEQPNFYGMFSQFRFQRNIEDNTTTIQRNQSAHTAKAEPILELMWSKRLLFGHFRTKNKFASQNRLVRLPHLLIQSENKSPVQNTIYGSRFFSFIQELYA